MTLTVLVSPQYFNQISLVDNINEPEVSERTKSVFTRPRSIQVDDKPFLIKPGFTWGNSTRPSPKAVSEFLVSNLF